MTRKTVVTSDLTQQIAMRDIMLERLHPVEGRVDNKGRPLWRYEDGWNDDVVAKEADPTLNENHAAKVRMSQFGPVIKQQAAGHAATRHKLILRIEELEVRYNRLVVQFHRHVAFTTKNAEEYSDIIGGDDD